MANLALAFSILGRDRGASRNLDKVGDAAHRTGKKFSGMQKLVAGGALGAGIVKFASSSVKAYAEAEAAQTKLTDAFARFPKLADSNIGSFRKLNEALATKTRFDDDATATGQAVLAQFDLTGKQIEKLTPLMQDYAAKTGQELPDAAKNLGLALLGNARALKAIGINLPKVADKSKLLAKAQGVAAKAEDQLHVKRRRLAGIQTVLHAKDKITAADRVRLRDAIDDVRRAEGKHKDALKGVSDAQKGAAKTGETFDRVVDGLTKKVGGFATKEGQTAAGKLEIMRNKFGEVQEQIGLKLMPGLIRLADYMNTTLIPAFSKLVDFIGNNSALFKSIAGIAAAFYLIIKAQKAVLAFQSIFRGKMVAEALLTSRAVGAASVGGGIGIGGKGKGKGGGLAPVPGAALVGAGAAALIQAKTGDSRPGFQRLIPGGTFGDTRGERIEGQQPKKFGNELRKLFPAQAQAKSAAKAAVDTRAEVQRMVRNASSQTTQLQQVSSYLAQILGVTQNLGKPNITVNAYGRAAENAEATMRQAVYRFGRNGKAFA